MSLSPCRSYSRNHSSRQTTAVETTAVHQPLLQAYQSAGGTSCRLLVCLCHARVAMHGRSFRTASVIVVVFPLPSVLDVFPSVEPTAIVNVCTQFLRFRTKRTFRSWFHCIYPCLRGTNRYGPVWGLTDQSEAGYRGRSPEDDCFCVCHQRTQQLNAVASYYPDKLLFHQALN